MARVFRLDGGGPSPTLAPQLSQGVCIMTVVLALSLWMLFSGCAQAAECFSYTGETTLTGKLVRRTFPEQPNYESIAKGDAAASYFFIVSRQPICVSEGENSDGLEPAESAVARIQLVFIDGKPYRYLRPYLGKQVVCRGSLYHAHRGHHHSPVLLSAARCQPVKPALSLAHDIDVPKKYRAGRFSAEHPRPGDGESAIERYVNAYERGWMTAVGNYMNDINHGKPLWFPVSGWPEEVAGGTDGYAAATERIDKLIRTYGKQQVSDYLQQFRDWVPPLR